MQRQGTEQRAAVTIPVAPQDPRLETVGPPRKLFDEDTMKKAYMVCDTFDKRASECGAWHVGIEFMGTCHGRIVDEPGNVLGQHTSSSFGWLRLDLASKVDAGQYEVIDLIGQPVPERFALRSDVA